MKPNFLILGSALSAVVAFGILAVVLWDRSEPRGKMSDEASVLRSRIRAVEPKTVRAERISIAGGLVSRPLAGDQAKMTNATVRATDMDDDALMDKVVRELLQELDDASRKGNSKRILALVEKLRALQYGAFAGGRGSARGTSSIKSRILETLSEIGLEGLGPIIDLLGDSDPAIAQRATDLLFKSLQSPSLGDRDRAEIVVSAAEEMTEAASLDRLFQEFIKMRHSVGIGALTQIGDSGTDQAKAILPRVVAAFTADPTIQTADQLQMWLEDHPDSRYDNWYYGPRTGKNSVQLPNAKVEKTE